LLSPPHPTHTPPCHLPTLNFPVQPNGSLCWPPQYNMTERLLTSLLCRPPFPLSPRHVVRPLSTTITKHNQPVGLPQSRPLNSAAYIQTRQHTGVTQATTFARVKPDPLISNTPHQIEQIPASYVTRQLSAVWLCCVAVLCVHNPDWHTWQLNVGVRLSDSLECDMHTPAHDPPTPARAARGLSHTNT
jgi:hypothetical protein